MALPCMHPAARAAVAEFCEGENGTMSFLRFVISPFYEFVQSQMSRRLIATTKLSERAMYDDVNEFFWSRSKIRQLITRPAKNSNMLFPELLSKLAEPDRLLLLNRKSFVEHSSWLVVMYTFHRMLLLNILAVHVMVVLAFTRGICEDESREMIPNPAFKDARESALQDCLTESHGTYGLKLFSTVTLSHAGFQIIFNFISLWVEPRKPYLNLASLWSFFSFVLPVLLISFYAIEKLRTDYYSGLSDSFIWAAIVYTGLWLPSLLQIPMRLPGYNHCWAGIAPQWVMRPQLVAGLHSSVFFAIVVGIKWFFEYFVLIKGLYTPSLAIWVGDYHCWELGHTGLLGCEWDQSSDAWLRDARDWVVRLMLLMLRWSMPILIVMSDIIMFYVLVMTVASAWIGRRQKIGKICSWPHLVLGFMQTQLLCTEKLMSYPKELEKKICKERIHRGEEAEKGFSWSYEGISREWRDFGVLWNTIVESLRKRDLLSNSEHDELIFASLDLPDHTLFFGVPQFMVLPAMVSAPIFAASRGKSVISPSDTSYAAFQPALLQLRDLNIYLLVSMGLIKFDDRKKMRALLSNLMQSAHSIFNLKLRERDKLQTIMSKWEGFIRSCKHASEQQSSADDLHVAKNISLSYQNLLTELSNAVYDEGMDFSYRIDLPSLDELFDILRKNSVTFRRRTFTYVSAAPPVVEASEEEDDGDSPSPGDMGEQSPGNFKRTQAGDKAHLMFSFLTFLRHGHGELTVSEAKSMLSRLREPATQSVLRVLSQFTLKDNPGSEPRVSEAKRQLISFCSSLHQTPLSKAPPVTKMRSFSVLTPFFREDVQYSVQALQSAGHDNTTLLTLFKALHPDEWSNFCERVQLLESDVKNEGFERSNDEKIGRSLEEWNKVKLQALLGKNMSEMPSMQQTSSPRVKNTEQLGESSVQSRISIQSRSSLTPRLSTPRWPPDSRQSWRSHSPFSGTRMESALGHTLTFHPQPRTSHASSFYGARQRGVSQRVSFAINVDAASEEPTGTLDRELQQWASNRAQVLSRTVRGVMTYADALRIQAKLEQVPEDEIEELVSSKFEHVVSCQVYDQLKHGSWEDQFKAESIDQLRKEFPRHLRVAFVERSEGLWYSVLLGVDPETTEEKVLFKVQLPGNPILGEGKPENQNHAIIFVRGEYMQTLDMNQDAYLGESLKMRNLLECFKGSIRIVGCREHIFSGSDGANAAFAAASEFASSTILQRFMTYPLAVRFHYGHPDVWDKQWVAANGGVSKASHTLHISESFGGVNVLARGGSVFHCEFFHVGKASRGLGLGSG
ncbi:MAG: hypothetical protein SGPRY_000300 [Prymnesium sp.]